MESILAEDIETVGRDAKYDQACKKLLSHKEILARIMQQCLEEYKDCTVQDIIDKYIEGQPEVGTTPVLPDHVGRIHGDTTEDVSLSEQTIWYDIRFHAIAPDASGYIGLIINVEAQNRYRPTYPLTKRGIYYCARLISAQYGTDFVKSHYEKLKKVYSIWICTTPPGERQNSITEYGIYEKVVCGNATEEKRNYDLMRIVMLCLGDEDQTEEEVLRFLDVLFSSELPAAEKKSILTNEFDFEMNDSMEGEMEQMCNLSIGVWEKGREKGRLEGRAEGRLEGRAEGRLEGIEIGEFQRQLLLLQNLMETAGWSLDMAAAALKISEEDKARCKMILEAEN